MDEPQQYQLKDNPGTVRTAMKWTGGNFTELKKWCPNIMRAEDDSISLGRTIPLVEGDWILHDEGKGIFWKYGLGAGGDGFLLDWEPYEAPSAKEARLAKEEARRVDL